MVTRGKRKEVCGTREEKSGMAARGKRKEVYTYEVGGSKGREKRRGRYIAEELKAKPPTFKYCLEMSTDGSRAATNRQPSSAHLAGCSVWALGLGLVLVGRRSTRTSHPSSQG